MTIRLPAPILALILVLLPAPVLAWGPYAHALIARTALAELTPVARAEVRRILAGGLSTGTPDCPIVTIADASTWPDCVRSLPDRYKYSFPWHYQNIDTRQSFDIAANCSNNDCVTAQIPRQLAIMADRRASPAARATALAFVVHFVGDMHMPLHIGDRADRGGNDVIAAYGRKVRPRLNLHGIWDGDLAERSLTEPPAVTATSPTPAQRRAWAQGNITDWARESWEASRTIVYPNLTATTDRCPDAAPRCALVDETYVAAARATVRLQVERAGVRLAVLLNQALAR
ncbi:MAG: hypothetical protein CFE37_05085 [Alphaproteobacteria bacterium PA4]|nr:MAG: hypothetical protein CFE37_05085 [Alphaproteobacteria bacterium PA4]